MLHPPLHLWSSDGFIRPPRGQCRRSVLRQIMACARSDNITGNDILKWEISGAPAKGVIAIAYIFVGVYGLTWVSIFSEFCFMPLPLTHILKAPAAWIYASEVFPLKYRAKGVGLSAAGNWMSVMPSS